MSQDKTNSEELAKELDVPTVNQCRAAIWTCLTKAKYPDIVKPELHEPKKSNLSKFIFKPENLLIAHTSFIDLELALHFSSASVKIRPTDNMVLVMLIWS